MSTQDDDPRGPVQRLINEDRRMVGIEVTRAKYLTQKKSMIIAELASPEQCRSVLAKKKILTSSANKRVFINPAKSPEVLNIERSLKSVLSLIPGAQTQYKFNNKGRLVKKRHPRHTRRVD